MREKREAQRAQRTTTITTITQALPGVQREVTPWCLLKRQVIVLQPIFLLSPTHTIAQLAFSLIINFTAYFQPDFFLDAKAKTTLTVFYPQLVDRPQIIARKILDRVRIEPTFLLEAFSGFMHSD